MFIKFNYWDFSALFSLSSDCISLIESRRSIITVQLQPWMHLCEKPAKNSNRFLYYIIILQFST